ncbi:MAG: hypothetical protein J6K38_00135 [Alistipes sp.]|nr:hypothetical protein [Alistipes sp.]
MKKQILLYLLLLPAIIIGKSPIKPYQAYDGKPIRMYRRAYKDYNSVDVYTHIIFDLKSHTYMRTHYSDSEYGYCYIADDTLYLYPRCSNCDSYERNDTSIYYFSHSARESKQHNFQKSATVSKYLVKDDRLIDVTGENGEDVLINDEMEVPLLKVDYDPVDPKDILYIDFYGGISGGQ